MCAEAGQGATVVTMRASEAGARPPKGAGCSGERGPEVCYNKLAKAQGAQARKAAGKRGPRESTTSRDGWPWAGKEVRCEAKGDKPSRKKLTRFVSGRTREAGWEPLLRACWAQVRRAGHRLGTHKSSSDGASERCDRGTLPGALAVERRKGYKPVARQHPG